MTAIVEPTWEERRTPEAAHEDDARSQYRKDYSRIIHSAALRRLQTKTQVLGLGDSDFYRTRLTHSLEVAQIGVGILLEIQRRFAGSNIEKYLPDERLLEAICLSHDYGHPPFGHGGERALNFAMREYGGFEGNAQTFRILSKLEKYSQNSGLNPTRRTLLGVLKYPTTYSNSMTNDFRRGTDIDKYPDAELKPPKCIYDCDLDVLDWVLKIFCSEDVTEFKKLDYKCKPLHKSLDCSLMETADDIAYTVHDLEDCIKLKLINREMWDAYIKSADYSEATRLEIEKWNQRIFSKEGNLVKQGISNMVYFFIHSVIQYEHEELSHPILKYGFKLGEEAARLRSAIQKIITNEVIKAHRVRVLESKGQRMIFSIFGELVRDPESFLPRETLDKYNKATGNLRMRVICDYVSGMTDEYATKTYQRFFTPKFGSVFDV